MKEQEKKYVLELINREEKKIENLIKIVNNNENEENNRLQGYYVDIQLDEEEINKINNIVSQITDEIERLKKSLGEEDK